MNAPLRSDYRSSNNPLVTKLQNVTALSEEDQQALDDLCREVREVSARKDIMQDGAKPSHVHLMLEGWAARYKILPDGGRQITAFLIPGDFCDVHVTILSEMDHGIVALTPARIAYIPHSAIKTLTERPQLARALWWATLVDEAVLRAWIVNLGRRDAFQHLAHLLCELHERMRNIGLVAEDSFDLPLTQEEIADALGLTPVHTNRVIQRLRSEGLITLKGHNLVILDAPGLQKASGFNPAYLHARDRI